MKEVPRRLHADIFSMWSQLVCFYGELVTLQQNQSQDKPDRLLLGCSKNKMQVPLVGQPPLEPKEPRLD